MKLPTKIASFVLFLIIFHAGQANAQTGEQHIKAMHARYFNNWYKTLAFTQDTEIYRNDSVIRKSTWYEMVRFPYELRIDVDSINGGNKTYYLKDSTYRIRNNRVQNVAVDPNPFIFFLGGMYMIPFDSVKAILRRDGYDLARGGKADWKGRETLLIGANNKEDSARNQVWVDAEHLYIVRIRLVMGTALLDVHLSDHVRLSSGWSETDVQFFRNGKLLQREKYRDIKPDVTFTNEVFDVSKYR